MYRKDIEKPQRKQITSFYLLDDYPEYDDDFSDSCSDDDSECSEHSYETIDSMESDSSGLFTIQEETEEDLMSYGTCDLDLGDRSEDISISAVSTPRIRISLDEYLEKHRPSNLHDTENESETSDTESLDVEQVCKQPSTVSFASFGSSTNGGSFQNSSKSMDEDSNSISSNSTHGSNRLAMLKLQRQLSAQKLKQAIEDAELSSSFRKDEVTTDSTKKCIVSLEESLLNSPQTPRASDSYRKSRRKLISAMALCRNALMVSLE